MTIVLVNFGGCGMKYGYFDNEKREYVIEQVDLPASWTNYLGVNDLCAVVNHTAGGYIFYKSPEYHCITRFRANIVPLDRPGHYVYLKDNDCRDYWSISWQPVGKPLDRAEYRCVHGMSYTRYECRYHGISASQTLVIPLEDPVELWDVRIKNETDRERDISIYSYCEFAFQNMEMDHENYQKSMYTSGISYEDGIIEHDLRYEESGYQYFTSSVNPDGFDCLRDRFLGLYRTESNPIGVERGLVNSCENGTNHCGALYKRITLMPWEEVRLVFMLGEGDRETGRQIRAKYTDVNQLNTVYEKLKAYWDEKFERLQIRTPNEGMNTMINTWTLYQAEMNMIFSRFASLEEVGRNNGLVYRDTAQDALTIPHSNPEKCRQRLEELMRGLVSGGYGKHIIWSEGLEPRAAMSSFHSPSPFLADADRVRTPGIEEACSDDALWLVSAAAEYVKETGDFSFLGKEMEYADGGSGTVYEHLMRILDFSAGQTGENGICSALHTDWNDCLNLSGGESALVSFLHVWAIRNFLELAEFTEDREAVEKYTEQLRIEEEACGRELWDGDWYIRGITRDGRRIGTHEDREGKVHLEANTWAVFSGAAPYERGIRAMDSVEEYLYTPYGLLLNAPAYTQPDDGIGFVTRIYPGIRENSSVFSHPNPTAWAAESRLGRGDRAMQYYDALCPYYQNDMIEIREAEPYSYCQFAMGRDHTGYGRARHPFMTGCGGWAYFSATRYILGVRPQLDDLEIDPCVPGEWEQFEIQRIWRGVTYKIRVENPQHVMCGVKAVYFDGEERTPEWNKWDERRTAHIPLADAQTEHTVRIIMGEN